MRLPFFPVPAEGETVFSVVGRCAERLGIANRELMTILTGQHYVRTLFSPLPGYLSKIASSMPSGHPWQDINLLIKNHTGLPYFSYFHPSDKRLLTLKNLAKAENSQPITVGMGLTIYRTPASPKGPRFCLKCINEQITNYGFAYFQVAHQLPGVSVCWKHDQVLYDGCDHCGRYPLAGKMLTMPGQCLCNSFEPTPVSTYPVAEGAKWIARNSAYLLTSQPFGDDPIEKLHKGVLKSGLGRGSHVNHILLAEAVEAQFGREFLSTINYPVSEDGKPSAWLRRYLSNGITGRQLPTIAGLLISAAAFESIQDFESNNTITRQTVLSRPATPDTELPEQWKINLQKTLSTHDFRIASCAAALNRTPWDIAIAARDQNISVPLSSPTIKRIGHKRITQIIQELENGIQKKKILTAYKISEWTLLLIELSDPNIRNTHKKKASDTIHQCHRKSVLDLLARNPDITRSDIIQHLPGSYDYLISRDKTWFQTTIPRVRRKQEHSRAPRRIWKNFDDKLSVAITETASQALTSDAKPKRITATALLSQHGELQRYTAQPDKFPETRKALEKIVETTEQFLLRKVSWGIKQLNLAEQEISIDSLRRKCAIPTSKLHPHLGEIRTLIYSLGGQISKKSKLLE